ncbi:MAG TPA: MBL fold metallo-hydrolase [Candidatus Acidoferrales bacterium]
MRVLSRIITAVLFTIACIALVKCTHATPQTGKPLEVYFVDVEGGQATLFVTPERQSLLIDTGWSGFAGRDVDRIVAAAKNAGISKIDFVLITHYHRDHVGGASQLAAKIPIGAFIDHGPNREPNDPDTEAGWQAYQKLLADKKIKRITVKVGDVLPIRGIRGEVVSADGGLIATPLSDAGAQNPICATAEKKSADQTENARSLGTVITFGKTRILDLGDLTWDKEMEMVCPVNKLGHMDIFIVSHHGLFQSNSPALVSAISPRIAIMDNGADKGGSSSTLDILKKYLNFDDIWQLHFSNEGGAAHNADKSFIANLSGPDAGNYLKLTVWDNQIFDVFNSRTTTTMHYGEGD